jgi:hypothetical protein
MGQRTAATYCKRSADDLCFVKSLWTEAINHDPAMTFFQTGSQIAGRPSLGSWLTYGLGSDNENLPGFVVLVTKKPTDQPLAARLWGTGFLDSRYQGVRFSSGKDAVFYLSNPDGICQSGRRALLDKLSALNKIDFENELDPEIETRIAQYEMAFRMQTSVPEVTDFSAASHNRSRNSTARMRRSPAPSPPTACSPAAWPSAACVSSSSTTPAGTSTATCRPSAAVPGNRPGLRRPHHRPQTTRHVGRHARRLGRRVRPHLLLAGCAHRDQLRPRPPPPLLHHLDGRRRRQTRHHLRCHRRIRLQHRRSRRPGHRALQQNPANPTSTKPPPARSGKMEIYFPPNHDPARRRCRA